MEGIKDPSNVSPFGLHQFCQPSSFVVKPHTLQLSNNLLDCILCVWVRADGCVKMKINQVIG